MNYRNIIDKGTLILKNSSILSAKLDAELLLTLTLNIPREKVWFMPAGDSRESLFKSYPVLFDWVRDNGYRMTWRPHIIAFEDKREV